MFSFTWWSLCVSDAVLNMKFLFDDNMYSVHCCKVLPKNSSMVFLMLSYCHGIHNVLSVTNRCFKFKYFLYKFYVFTCGQILSISHIICRGPPEMPFEIACLHFEFNSTPPLFKDTTIVGFFPLQVHACRVAKANWKWPMRSILP